MQPTQAFHSLIDEIFEFLEFIYWYWLWLYQLGINHCVWNMCAYVGGGIIFTLFVTVFDWSPMLHLCFAVQQGSCSRLSHAKLWPKFFNIGRGLCLTLNKPQLSYDNSYNHSTIYRKPVLDFRLVLLAVDLLLIINKKPGVFAKQWFRSSRSIYTLQRGDRL